MSNITGMNNVGSYGAKTKSSGYKGTAFGALQSINDIKATTNNYLYDSTVFADDMDYSDEAVAKLQQEKYGSTVKPTTYDENINNIQSSNQKDSNSSTSSTVTELILTGDLDITSVNYDDRLNVINTCMSRIKEMEDNGVDTSKYNDLSNELIAHKEYLESMSKPNSFYSQYRNAGYTDEQISNIEKYPPVDQYLPDKDASSYYDESKINEVFRIDNIPCTSSEKQELIDLQNQINENKKLLEGLNSEKEDLTYYAGVFNPSNNDTFYLPKDSDTYYYLPPNGVCTVTIPHISGYQYGTPTYSGYDNIKVSDNNAYYAANIDIDIKKTEEKISKDEETLLQRKKELIIANYEKIIESPDYEEYVKNLDTDKRLNYHTETVPNIVGHQYGTAVISGTKTIQVVSLYSNSRLNETEIYEHMTQEQKNIFCYYLDKYGAETANKYLDSIIESVNFSIAFDNFNSYKNSLNFDNEQELIKDLHNKGLVSEKAFSMGLANFLIDSLTVFADKSYTDYYMKQPIDYERQMILVFLATQDPEWAKRYGVYEKIGELFLPATAAVVLTAAGHPTAGARLFSILTGISKTGATMKDWAQKGYNDDIWQYYVGAGAKGLSKFVVTESFTYLLSMVGGDVAKGIVDVIATMTAEVSSDYIDELFENFWEGKEITIDTYSDMAVDALKSGIVAALAKGSALNIKMFKGKEITTISISTENMLKISKEITTKSTIQDIAKIILKYTGKVFDVSDLTKIVASIQGVL